MVDTLLWDFLSGTGNRESEFQSCELLIYLTPSQLWFPVINHFDTPCEPSEYVLCVSLELRSEQCRSVEGRMKLLDVLKCHEDSLEFRTGLTQLEVS